MSEKEDIDLDFCLRFNREWTPSKLAAFGTYGNLQIDIEKYYRANFNDSRVLQIFKNKYVEGLSAKEVIKIIRHEK